MNEDLISIIVPIYKVENYIRKCVDSILSQTYSNLEIILVDDGSPDNCPAICDEYAEKDERIKVIHQQNGGLSAAKNAGLDIAKGKYIGFVDSDDYIDPEMYAKLHLALVEKNADIAICNYKQVNEEGKFAENEYPLSEGSISGRDALRILQSERFANYVVSWNKLYSIGLFQNIRFPIGRLHEDHMIAFQLYFQCSKVAIISDSLYFYFQRAESITSTINLKRFDSVYAVEQKIDFYREKGISELIVPSQLQLLKRYRILRIFVNEVTESEREILDHYDALAKDVYRELGKNSSWKDKLFFNCFPLYKLMLIVKYPDTISYLPKRFKLK